MVGYYLIISGSLEYSYILTETWGHVSQANIIQPELIGAYEISYSLIAGLISLVTLILLPVLLLILLAVAVLFISQGTANLNLSKNLKEGKIDINEAKEKLSKFFKIAFSVTFLGSLLFLKPFYDLIPFYDVFHKSRFGFVFGFPAEYVYFLDGRMTYFSFYGISIDLLFVLLFSFGISWIYYRFILNAK